MTETAAPAPAAAQQITISPTPADNGDSDMFAEASSFHEFQASVNKRTREQREKAKQVKQTKLETKTAPATTAVTEAPADVTEALHPPTETPQQDAPDETLETSEQTTETPADPATEAAQAADMELLGKFKAWMAGGEMPAELAEVPVLLPNGTHEPFSEVVKGYMRQDDHTRGWQEATQKVQQAESALGAYKQHFDYIEKSPPAEGGKALHEIYTRNGMRKALFEASRILAIEEQQDFDSANGTMIAVMQRERIQDVNDHRAVTAFNKALAERERIRALDDSDRQKAWEIERLRAAQQTRQQENSAAETRKQLDKQLDQLRPLAFKQLGILHDDENKQIFWNKLGARVNQLIAKGEAVNQITPAIVMDAARMTRDHIEDERKRRGAKPAPKPQPKTFQPQLGGGAGKIAGTSKQADLQDDDEFARKFGLRRL